MIEKHGLLTQKLIKFSFKENGLIEFLQYSPIITGDAINAKCCMEVFVNDMSVPCEFFGDSQGILTVKIEGLFEEKYKIFDGPILSLSPYQDRKGFIVATKFKISAFDFTMTENREIQVQCTTSLIAKSQISTISEVLHNIMYVY